MPGMMLSAVKILARFHLTPDAGREVSHFADGETERREV